MIAARSQAIGRDDRGKQGKETTDGRPVPAVAYGTCRGTRTVVSLRHERQSIRVQYDYRHDSLHNAIIRSDDLSVVIDGGYAITEAALQGPLDQQSPSIACGPGAIAGTHVRQARCSLVVLNM
jgi:hypothetical protein